jgi:hypothetical protein
MAVDLGTTRTENPAIWADRHKMRWFLAAQENLTSLGTTGTKSDGLVDLGAETVSK